jgi:hypothetical protein
MPRAHRIGDLNVLELFTIRGENKLVLASIGALRHALAESEH